MKYVNRYNKLMKSILDKLGDSLYDHPKAIELKQLLEASISNKDGIVFWENRGENACYNPEFDFDETGFEANINKIYLEDYLGEADGRSLILESIAFMSALKDKVKREIDGEIEIVLSIDLNENSATLRFYRKRKGQDYLGVDIEGYKMEAILVM